MQLEHSPPILPNSTTSSSNSTADYSKHAIKPCKSWDFVWYVQHADRDKETDERRLRDKQTERKQVSTYKCCAHCLTSWPVAVSNSSNTASAMGRFLSPTYLLSSLNINQSQHSHTQIQQYKTLCRLFQYSNHLHCTSNSMTIPRQTWVLCLPHDFHPPVTL